MDVDEISPEFPDQDPDLETNNVNDVDEITPEYPESESGNDLDYDDSLESDSDEDSSDDCENNDSSEDINITLRSMDNQPVHLSEQVADDAGTSSKRKYRYINRKQGSKGESDMRKKWKSNILSTCELLSMKCCKKECFSNSNVEALVLSHRFALTASVCERRDMLRAMIVSDGKFHYDGKPVCSTFLLKSFNFSRDLQSSVKKAPNNYIDRGVYNRKAKMRESIVDIINRLAELIANKNSDKKLSLPTLH